MTDGAASLLAEPLHGTGLFYRIRVMQEWRRGLDFNSEVEASSKRGNDGHRHTALSSRPASQLSFSQRTTQLLMKIAQDRRLPNAAHGSHLPCSRRALYRLTRQNDAPSNRLLDTFRIQTDMERQELLCRVKVEQGALAQRRSGFAGCQLADFEQLSPDVVRFGAILADPPWTFVSFGSRGAGRSASNHRRAATVADTLTADNALLSRWAVDWLPLAAKDVIKQWGFQRVKAAFTWLKRDSLGEGFFTGLGHCTRANPEACLRGDVAQLFISSAQEHSRGPYQVHERVEQLVQGPCLGLPAPRCRRDWTTGGDGLPKTEIQAGTYTPCVFRSDIVAP